MIAILLLLIACFMLISRIRFYIKVKNCMKKEVSKRHDLQVVFGGRSTVLGYLFIAIIMIMVLVIRGNYVNETIFVAWFFIYSIAQCIQVITEQTFYYGKQGFYLVGQYVAYSDIEELSKKRLLFQVCSVKLKNGEGFSLAEFAYNIVQDHMK